MNGKQVKLFLVDGTPGGLTTAEITNWTGSVMSARRSELAELLRREEAARTGVYLLLGDDEDAIGDTRCYVGEADTVATRLRAHANEASKPFWNQTVVVTSKDTNLTKSHVRYLEARIIELATKAGRVTLENGTSPPCPNLPEADVSDMEYFIGQLQIVLPVLGVNAIRVREARATVSAPSASPVFSLRQKKGNIDARAQQIDGEFIMLQGSGVASSWVGTPRYGYYAQREGLVADGSIVVDGERGQVTRDIVFSSPSAASSVALGRSSNGRTSWQSAEGTFDQWERRGVGDE